VIEQLLEAVLAAPDDDAPRLVYADALLERGDLRGELIVRQCRGDAASDLVEQYGDAWLGELAPLLSASVFERGFLTKATVRPQQARAIEPVVGHPLWRTVRELRGPAAIALHPSMTALRVLHVSQERTLWRELLSGTPRDLVELHYRPVVDESWDPDNDVTATPQSGGVWSYEVIHEELAALAECTALPKLRRLVLTGVLESSLPTVLGGSLLARVPVVETHHGPIAVELTGGLARITLAPTASPHHARAILDLVRLLPAQLAIELVTGPRFENRQLIERALGDRLRR
jgi:uncharacterized protein (TIGR02996 family)